MRHLNNDKNVLHMSGKENAKKEQMKQQNHVRRDLQTCENEEGKKLQRKTPRNVRVVLGVIMSVGGIHGQKTVMKQNRDLKKQTKQTMITRPPPSARTNIYYYRISGKK